MKFQYANQCNGRFNTDITLLFIIDMSLALINNDNQGRLNTYTYVLFLLSRTNKK